MSVENSFLFSFPFVKFSPSPHVPHLGSQILKASETTFFFFFSFLPGNDEESREVDSPSPFFPFPELSLPFDVFMVIAQRWVKKGSPFPRWGESSSSELFGRPLLPLFLSSFSPSSSAQMQQEVIKVSPSPFSSSSPLHVIASGYIWIQSPPFFPFLFFLLPFPSSLFFRPKFPR